MSLLLDATPGEESPFPLFAIRDRDAERFGPISYGFVEPHSVRVWARYSWQKKATLFGRKVTKFEMGVWIEAKTLRAALNEACLHRPEGHGAITLHGVNRPVNPRLGGAAVMRDGSLISPWSLKPSPLRKRPVSRKLARASSAVLLIASMAILSSYWPWWRFSWVLAIVASLLFFWWRKHGDSKFIRGFLTRFKPQRFVNIRKPFYFNPQANSPQ